MEVGKILTATIAAVALGGGAVSLTAASAAPSTHYRHYVHPYVRYMVNRNVEASQVRPHSINDGYGYSFLGPLHWTSWNAHYANGNGLEEYSHIRLRLGRPVWFQAPMGPTEYRVFTHMRIYYGHHGKSYLLKWHQDTAMGGHWAR